MMKIKKLEIENFKAIKHLKLDILSDTVLIAGPNGCGKSCIFHAIRLLKSVIGGYQDNEWHLWFNEFQISPQNLGQDIIKLFQTDDRKLQIKADFELSEEEKTFLKNEGKDMLEYQLWKRALPNIFNTLDQQYYKARPLGAQYGDIAKKITESSKQLFENLNKELSQPKINVCFEADVNGVLTISPTKSLQLAFSFFEKDLGIIDYHGPDRNYHKETLNNINLNIKTSHQSIKQHSLYNYTNKYSNVKQEMVGSYIRSLLTKEAGGVVNSSDSNLIDTLKELFNEFFPGKEFLDPQPSKTGGIDFPVKLKNGTTHDINDLSSGEKEVLYGYLRLRSSTPKNSIIMIDEPELHLNPKLISGLPHFYKKHLSEKMGNQILLITHSDAFLREAMREKDYQVYHIKPPFSISSYKDNQIKVVNVNNDLEEAIIDLVGDLATYSPDKKNVLLEGENSEFDSKMITKLFPEFSEKVNLLSAGSKHKVIRLHELLEKANQEGQLHTKFFSIIDKDLHDDNTIRSIKAFQWDVYHIENYLLNEDYLLKSVNGLLLQKQWSIEEINDLLLKCAKESIGVLIKDILTNEVYKKTPNLKKIGCDPENLNISIEIYNSLQRKIDNLSKIPTKDYLQKLQDIEKQKRKEFNQAFCNYTWKEKVKGRDVLKRLVATIN